MFVLKAKEVRFYADITSQYISTILSHRTHRTDGLSKFNTAHGQFLSVFILLSIGLLFAVLLCPLYEELG